MSTQGLSGGGFDFDTQAGIANVLASVRAANISAEQRNDIRDTIFLYTNGGRDQTVRISLEQKLATYGIVPVAPAASAQVPQPVIDTSPLGAGRSAPNAFSVMSPQPTPAPQTPPSAPQPVAPAQPVVEPAPQPTVPGNPDAYLARIREIKALVNEKVGNPVNLVDINNDVGREYMGALLDAMKKINSGASAVSAMQRLEVAFKSVEKAIADHDAQQNQPAPAVVAPEPIPQPTPAPVQSAPVTAPPPAPQPVAPAEPVPAEPATVSPTPAPKSEPIPEKQPEPSIQPPIEPVNRVPIQEVPDLKKPASSDADEARWANDKIPSTTSSGSPSSSAVPKIPSLADTLAQSADKNDASKTAEAKPASGDPLYSSEIDSGLDQLLSEWSLFKKSGLFGTGPKGREHPLFKKIAGLQIPLLLAGRFEGATQEIKQSITDYMNGWRYEQGIVYMQGETFERYLRRVIKHILDLQKSKPTA